MTAAAPPPGRYDGPRGLIGRRRTVATCVTVLVGLVLAYLVFARVSSGRPTGSVVAYRVSSDHQVQVVFDVRRPAGREAVCVVRARDRDGVEVGSQDTPVPATDRAVVRVTTLLATRGRAATGEVQGCAVRRRRP